MASVKIILACLVWLFILVFWGTVAQVDQGLYAAQKRFFYSYFFTVFGFIPLPGGQLTLWIMFINLVCAGLVHFVYKWSQIGILVIHLGLLSYFVAAFVTFHGIEESNLSLPEGEGSNVSSSYNEWELSIWPDAEESPRHVSAYDTNHFKENLRLNSTGSDFSIFVRKYFPNAEVLRGQDLTSLALNKEPEKNLPGGIFEIQTAGGQSIPFLLYGAASEATQIKIGQNRFDFALRRKRYPLPFTLTLQDFTMERYPGTETARSYQSKVKIEYDGISREVLIYMNNPLRYKDFTLYQSSYAIDEWGREISTLAVVKNAGRLLPYIASFITFFGLVVHFGIMGVLKSKSRK